MPVIGSGHGYEGATTSTGSVGSSLFGGIGQQPQIGQSMAQVQAENLAMAGSAASEAQSTSAPTRPITPAETMHTLGPESALLEFGGSSSTSTPAPLSTSSAPAPTALAKSPSPSPVIANPNIIGSPTGTTLAGANQFYFNPSNPNSPVNLGDVVPLGWGNGQPLTQGQTTYETGLFNARNGIPLTNAEKTQLLSPPSGSPGTIGSLLSSQISSYLSKENPEITASNEAYFSPFGPQTKQQAFNTLSASQQAQVVQQALLQQLEQLGLGAPATYQQMLSDELARLKQTSSQAALGSSASLSQAIAKSLQSIERVSMQPNQIGDMPTQMNVQQLPPQSILQITKQSPLQNAIQPAFPILSTPQISSSIGQNLTKGTNNLETPILTTNQSQAAIANLQNQMSYNLANSYLQNEIYKYLQNPTLNGAISLGDSQFFNPTYAALRLAQIGINSPALLQNLAASIGNIAASVPNFLLGTNLKAAIQPTDTANPVVAYLKDTYPQNVGYAVSYPLALLGRLGIPYISQGSAEASPYISALAATVPQAAASLVSPNQTPLSTAGNLLYLGTSAVAPEAAALYGGATAGIGAGINYLTGSPNTPQSVAQNYQFGAELAGPFKAAGALGDVLGAGKTGLGGFLTKGIPTSSLMALLQAGQQATNGNTNPVSLAEAGALGYAGGTALQALPNLAGPLSQPLKDYLNSIKLNTADWTLLPDERIAMASNNLKNLYSSLLKGYNVYPIGYDAAGNPIFGRSLENAINLGSNGGLHNTLPVQYSTNPFDANLRMQLSDLIAKLNPNSGYTQDEVNQIIRQNLLNSGNHLPVPYNPNPLDANLRMALSDLYNKLNPNSGYTQSEINQIIKSNLNENGALADFLNIKNLYATPPSAPEANPLNNALEQLNTIANNLKYSELGNEQGAPNLASVIAKLPPRMDYNPQSGILKTYEAVADPTSPTGFRWQARSVFDLNKISPLTQALNAPASTRGIPFTSEYTPNFILEGKPYYPGQTLPALFKPNPSLMNENDAAIAALIKAQFDEIFGKFSSRESPGFKGNPAPPPPPKPSDFSNSDSSQGGDYRVTVNQDGTISLVRMSPQETKAFLQETGQSLPEAIKNGDIASLLTKEQLDQESSKYAMGLSPYLQFLSEQEQLANSQQIGGIIQPQGQLPMTIPQYLYSLLYSTPELQLTTTPQLQTTVQPTLTVQPQAVLQQEAEVQDVVQKKLTDEQQQLLIALIKQLEFEKNQKEASFPLAMQTQYTPSLINTLFPEYAASTSPATPGSALLGLGVRPQLASSAPQPQSLSTPPQPTQQYLDAASSGVPTSQDLLLEQALNNAQAYASGAPSQAAQIQSHASPLTLAATTPFKLASSASTAPIPLNANSQAAYVNTPQYKAEYASALQRQLLANQQNDIARNYINNLFAQEIAQNAGARLTPQQLQQLIIQQEALASQAYNTYSPYQLAQLGSNPSAFANEQQNLAALKKQLPGLRQALSPTEMLAYA